jgi:hypothetical protein
MSNREHISVEHISVEHISVLNLRSHKDGIDRLDNNRHIAGSAGNVNPASLSKSAAATFCTALNVAYYGTGLDTSTETSRLRTSLPSVSAS